jgi:ubiquinone/menaquinone biosynthesis C-methylase UbiE
MTDRHDSPGDPSPTLYDSARIARFFDAFGEQEWPRLESDAGQRISFHLHRRVLERHVKRGDLVLEVGAGPGRFTLELARLGAAITVTDISLVQLELNRTRVADAGLAQAVAEWKLADVTNLRSFAENSFDAVVAFGGPLSYVLDRRAEAVAEMIRVTRPGGCIVVSVMSRAGAFRKFLSGLLALYETNDAETIRVINHSRATGDLVDTKIQTEDHYMHLFTADELRSLLAAHELEILEMSAANFITVQNEEWLETVQEDSDFWRFVVQLEERFANESGALDGGTHIIAAARKAT